MAAYTKKFKEFIEDQNPDDGDYVVGYRKLDDSEVRIPLHAIDNSITANKYVRKDIDDHVNGIIRFNNGATFGSNIMSVIYLQGLSGWLGDSDGNFEMNSLRLREFLEVPELRKNKITVMGNQFWFTDSAMVKTALPTGGGRHDVYFKLEDLEYASFELNDILKGIYHYDNGFYTVYLRVYELILDPNTTGEIGVRVESLNGKAPMQAMLLARMNNSQDSQRQGSIFADGLEKYIRILDGYIPSNPTSEGSLETLRMQMGDLSSIKGHPIFGDLEGYGMYADNVYIQGKIVVKNDPNRPGQELGVYRGQWDSQSTYYKYDQVTHKGSLYTSKQIDNTGNVPTGEVDDLWWELTVSKGNDGTSGTENYIIELSNDNHTIPTDSNGENPSYGGASSTAYVYEGSNDISSVYTIKATVSLPATPQTLHIVQNGNTATVTYMDKSLDAASVKFTATATGYPTLTKEWSISKVKSGTPGEDAVSYWLVTDSPVIKKLTTEVNGQEVIRYEPSPFVIRAFNQVGSGDVLPYSGFIRLTYGTQVKVVSGAVYSFIPEANVEKYTIELFQDAGLTVLLDKEIVSVVSDGKDGTTPNWNLYIYYNSSTAPATPTFKVPPASYPAGGWQDYPTSNGVWWMSTAIVDGASNTIAKWSVPIKVTGEDGNDGVDGADGINGADGVSLRYKGEFSSHPANPENGWYYYNTADGKSYVYQDGAWYQMTVDGINGSNGTNGVSSFKSTVFLRSNTTPATPTGGSYAAPVPSGWSDGAPNGVAILWTSSRVFSNTGGAPQTSTWSTPAQMTNTASFEAQYSTVQSNPGTPTTSPGNWSDAATTASIWMATRTASNGVWSAWSVSKIKGENGADGVNGISIVWKGDLATPPANPEINWVYRDTDNGRVYIWNGMAWELMVLDGSDGIDGTNGSDGFSVYITYHDNSIYDKPAKPTGNGTLNGWHTLPSSVCIWMSQKVSSSATAGAWGEPIQLRGENGQYIDFKYAKNTSTTTPPSIADTDRYPAGWLDKPPVILPGDYLWMTSALIKADNTLDGVWAQPIRVNGEQGPQGPQGPQGLSGADGLQGPSIVFGGLWENNKQYYGYADTQTAVKYNGKYYYTKTVSPQLSPITIPIGDANNPSTVAGKVYWNEFAGQFDNIATGLLLADRIATSELTANKLFIVNREESTGNIITADGSIITKDEEKNLTPGQIIGRLTQGWFMDQGVIRSIAVLDDKLTPKLKLDTDGTITAVGVNISGTVHFQDGTIANMEVFKDSAWTDTVDGPFPASSGAYYLRKNPGVTISPQGHIIGKDYFLTGDSATGPSVFIGDVYVPGYTVPGLDNTSLGSFINLFNSLFEKVLVGSQYHIKAKLPLFSVGELTAYGNDGMSVPSIWESIPVDKVTIDLIDGKLTVIGGTGGGIKAIVLPALQADSALTSASLNSAGDTITFTAKSFVLPTDSRLTNARPASDVYTWAKASTKPTYSYSEITGTPPAVDLSNYVTTDTPQTIQGQKTFTSPLFLNNSVISDSANSISLYTKEFGGQGLNVRSLLVSADYSYRQYVPDQGAYFVGDVKANSFAKHGGTANQFLKADGSVDSNAYVTINHNHTYLVTGDYRNRNPLDFSNRTFTPFFLAGSKLGLNGYFDAMYLNTYSDASGGKTNLLALSKVTGELYRMIVNQGATTWDGTLVKILDSDNYGAYAMSLSTEQVVTGRKVYSTNQYYNNNIGIVTIDGQGLIFSDGTRTNTGDGTRPHRIRSNNSNLVHWRTGVGESDILDGYNWQSVIDGRYLPLTGGLLTGPLTVNQDIKAGHMGWKAQLSSSSNTNEVLFGLALPDNSNNAYIRLGMNKIEYFNGANNTIWHAGNDGTGSGLDADMLDGVHLRDIYIPSANLSAVDGKTVLDAKNDLVSYFNENGAYGVGQNAHVSQTAVSQWDDDSASLRPSSVYDFIKIGGGYSGTVYGQWLLSSYGVSEVGIVGRNNSVWTPIKWLAFKDGNVASATKLQTPRSIFGQSFDGTANVSGALSGATTITSSSHIYAGGDIYNDGTGDSSFIGRNNAIEQGRLRFTTNDTVLANEGIGFIYFRPNGNAISTGQVTIATSGTVTANAFAGALSGNASSATKLQTARSIWGQSFDGTGNVRGIMSEVRSINGISATSIDYITDAAHYFYTNAGTSHRMAILANGDVGIGTATPVYRLDVRGTFRVTGDADFGSNLNVVGGAYINQKVIVDRTRYSATAYPSISLAIGDTDTGFDWASDGVFKIKANAVEVAQISTDRLQVYKNLSADGYSQADRFVAGFDSGVAGSVSCSNWFRSNGNTGWINDTYGGGIYMKDNGYVAVYNKKAFLVENTSYSAINNQGGYYSNKATSHDNNWVNALEPSNAVFNLSEIHGVQGNTFRNIVGWVDRINNVGYLTRYSIGSKRNAGGWGVLSLCVGNSDNGTSGNLLLLGGDGDARWSGAFYSKTIIADDVLKSTAGRLDLGLATLRYDAANRAIKVIMADESACNIYATGEVTAYSDRRLKQDIKALSNRGRLSAKTFIKDNKQQIGFIAQEVQELYPELISVDSSPHHYLSLNYGAITAVLSVQINEIDDEVSILKQKVKQLENKIKQYEGINF